MCLWVRGGVWVGDGVHSGTVCMGYVQARGYDVGKTVRVHSTSCLQGSAEKDYCA